MKATSGFSGGAIFGSPCAPITIILTLRDAIRDQAQAYADSKRQEIIKDLCAVMAAHGLRGTLQADNIARSAAGQIVQELAKQEADRRRQRVIDRMLSFTDGK